MQLGLCLWLFWWYLLTTWLLVKTQAIVKTRTATSMSMETILNRPMAVTGVYCTGGVIGCTEMACPPPQGCNFKGELYFEGQQFNEDCNTCTCGENGAVACTHMGCPVACKHNGKTYGFGDNFADECNRCRCTSTGVSNKACLPK